MNRLTIFLNGKHVDAHFTFDKGYEATFDDPGCPDDCEVHRVFYPADSKDQIDILPVMHEDDIQAIYNYIFDYQGENND